MKQKILNSVISFLLFFSSYSQGLFNQGARIVFSGGGQMVINGAAGNYSSTSGGLITPSSSSSITLGGNWINNSANVAFTTDGGAVILNGANQTIGGSNPSAFYHLTLSGSGTKQLAVNSTTVGGQSNFTGILSVNSLILDLNSNILNITNPAGSGIAAATGVIVSETNSAVNPSIVRWYMRTSTGIHDVPFGVTTGPTQIPLRFNITTAMGSTSDYVDLSTRSTAAADNLPWAGISNVSAVSFFYCPNNSLSANPCAINSVIDRWWDITPSSAVTTNLTLSYRGIENTLNAPYNIGMVGIQWWDGSAWNLDNTVSGSAAAVTSGVGSVSASGLSQFCPFVISSLAVPLPVEIIEMDVKCVSNGNLISWTTASENNSDYFIIEKSLNGIDFNEAGRVPAAGNSKKELDYSYTDNVLSEMNQNLIYYRIKEVDIFGNVKKYKILQSNNCNDKESTIQIANTINGEVFVTINSSKASSYTIELYDLLGRLMFTEQINANKGLNKSKLTSQSLSQSVYMISVQGNGIVKNQKVVISN